MSSDGLSGGLALFCNESLHVTVLDSSARYIDVKVANNSNGLHRSGTFVYGEPRVENRQLMWAHVVCLRSISDNPWLVCGDYNEALWQHEQFSRSMRAKRQMSAFRDTLNACEPSDLGFSGALFT